MSFQLSNLVLADFLWFMYALAIVVIHASNRSQSALVFSRQNQKISNGADVFDSDVRTSFRYTRFWQIPDGQISAANSRSGLIAVSGMSEKQTLIDQTR